jgi:hypothetical protein
VTGEQHDQDGAGSGRAVQGHAAAHFLHPVLQAGQARAAAGVGTANAVVADLDPQVPPASSMRMSTAEASACLAALVKALAAT